MPIAATAIPAKRKNAPWRYVDAPRTTVLTIADGDEGSANSSGAG
jgi:hypothetical protein